MKRCAVLAAFAAGVLALSILFGVARATQPTLQQTEFLSRGTTVDPLTLTAKGKLPNQKEAAWRGTYKSPWDVTTLRVTLPPGANTGWHRHPGPGFMSVVQGEVTVYANDCTKHTYTAGQAYVEVPGLVNLVRNDGSTPAIFVGTFVIPTTAPLRLDVPTAPCSP